MRKPTKYEGYEVSDTGIVWSCWTTNHKNPNARLGTEWHKMKLHLNKYEYHYVTLRVQNGKYASVFVHKLVLETFVGPCPPGMEARHFPDRCKTNNNLTNLSWGTLLEQFYDKVSHGTHITARSRLLTAFDPPETKTMGEWPRDPRCMVDYGTLNSRIRKGMNHELAITTPPRSNELIITAFDPPETKTTSEWVKDPRCVVDHRTLVDRIYHGMSYEKAITQPKQIQKHEKK